jgi:hypothetical protein
MGLFNILGKLLVVAALTFQAVQLFQDKASISSFNTKLTSELLKCDCLSEEIKTMIVRHLNLVVAALLASSVCFLVIKHWFFKLTSLLGLFILFWLNHLSKLNFGKLSLTLQNDAGILQSLGFIGAIIFIMSSECGSCGVKAAKTKTEEIREAVNHRYSEQLK